MGNEHSSSNAFRRELLPPPKSFYELELGKLSRPNRLNWSMGRCPFHQSKSGKSFAVNLETGAFHCFGCDAHGGDIVAFVMLREKLDFVGACKALNAWGPVAGVRSRPSGRLVRFLVWDFAINGKRYRAEIVDEPRTELQQLRRFFAEAVDRLTELRRGAFGFEREEDTQWGVMAHAWHLIQMEVKGQ